MRRRGASHELKKRKMILNRRPLINGGGQPANIQCCMLPIAPSSIPLSEGPENLCPESRRQKKVTVPKIGVPIVSVPKVGIPKVGVPKVSVPKVCIPKVRVPKASVPNVGVLKDSVLNVGVPRVRDRKSASRKSVSRKSVSRGSASREQVSRKSASRKSGIPSCGLEHGLQTDKSRCPHSPLGPGCPALLPMVRGMGSHAACHAAWGANGIRHQNLPTPHLAQGSRLCYPYGSRHGVPCRPGCKRDPAPNLPTPHLAQRARLCYP